MTDYKLFTSIEKLYSQSFDSFQDQNKKIVTDFVFRCAVECYLKLLLFGLRKGDNKNG